MFAISDITLIPAFPNSSKVLRTFTWSLSSTPVTHNNSISRSRVSTTVATLWARPVTANLAEFKRD